MRTRSCRTVFLSVPLGLLCLGSLAGCSKPAGAQGGDKAEAAPSTISLVKPVRQTVSHKVEQPGRIEAYEQTPLYAKIAGYVAEMKKDIGDPVRKGEVLATLRVPEMVEKLKQKDALVGQADAELKQSEAAAQAAEANVQTAKALVQEAEAGRARAGALVKRWQSEYERLKTLSKNVLDRQTLDETEYQLDAAKAFQQEVEAKVRSAEAGREESSAKRTKAKADGDAANAPLP